jgi:hypothetical protein
VASRAPFARPGRLARAVAVAFAVAAAYHAVLAWTPRAGDASSPRRHLAFVAVNAFFAVGFARRWRWLAVAVAPFAAQQVYSHGSALVTAMRAGEVDFASIGVLAFLPCVVVAALSTISAE